MMRTFSLLIIALISVGIVSAQQITPKDVSRSIEDLKLSGSVTLSYDGPSNMSKVMAVAENFSQKESGRAGLQAVNFAMAFTFEGKTLKNAPESIKLTFWVLTKKPKFETDHKWLAVIGDQTLDLGEARYVAKPTENMEYLNFVVKRDDLKKIAAGASRFKLGGSEFTPTPRQLQILDAMYRLSTI